ncbi:MAG: hypothetical protein AAGD07_16775 [Planctomycetota bacterium]
MPSTAHSSELLRLGDSITVLPVIHGSGQFAHLTAKFLLENEFDGVAVPLPPSFQEAVEQGVRELPHAGIVIQTSMPEFGSSYEPRSQEAGLWHEKGADSEADEEAEETDIPHASFVPIDPCQSVIAAIRSAMGEHVPRHFIDLETNRFEPFSTVMPDPYAVQRVAIEKFSAAVLPSIPRPASEQTRERMKHMAWRLGHLTGEATGQSDRRRIVMVTSVLHWPWLREAYNRYVSEGWREKTSSENELNEEELTEEPVGFNVEQRTLMFLFGELPYITNLYERARAELEDDGNLQIDGVKELLLAARDAYREDLGKRARKITPLLLSKCLRYIRNLSLIQRRMTPDMVTIVTAVQQILGDQFALHVAELASHYPFEEAAPASNLESRQAITLGIDQARLPDGAIVSLVSRLPGPPTHWRTLELKRRPSTLEKARWQYDWNPFAQCSYPPEDERIESLRHRVCERAQAILGQDLARTEKFTTSVKDGIDIRDTLRHWYEKEIYVKVLPPSRGKLDACLMLFDSPADPREYPWRTTWFAEHQWESTLAFYASNFREEMVGPGIGLGIYGGALFLFPPMVITDVWADRRLDFTETLEERLLAAACLHARGPQIAVMSHLPPGVGFRRLARRYKKQLVHVPFSSFNDAEMQQLRMVHVLNGNEVRSYAADFIRKV